MRVRRSSPPRVVSLIASATEIVCALGARGALVGRSHECDFPPDVASLPMLTEPKLPVTGASYEIDARVKAILQEGLSVYRVDAGALAALSPELIITQDQCEVCAVSLKDVEQAVCELAGDVRIVSLRPDCLNDVWTDIAKVADALGRQEIGDALIADLQARMQAIETRALTAKRRPRVVTIEWIDPLMTGGNWMPELVAAAGGEDLLGSAGKPSPWIAFDDIAAADPDIVVVHPCGFDIPRTLEDMPLLARDARWRTLRAVEESAVFVTDGNQYFNRPGPRVVESLEILAEIFHPDLFPGHHEGSGWMRCPVAAAERSRAVSA